MEPGEIFGEMGLTPVTIPGRVCRCPQQIAGDVFFQDKIWAAAPTSAMPQGDFKYAENVSNRINCSIGSGIPFSKNLRKKFLAYLLEEYKKERCNYFSAKLNRNDLADFINTSRPSLPPNFAKCATRVNRFYGNAIKIMDLQHCANM